MKKMKKIVSLVLAMVMVFAMAMTTSAAGEGSITINNAVEGETYSVYKIFDLESFNSESDAYSYILTNFKSNPWYDLVKDWVTFDENGNGYVTATIITDDNAESFAKAALAYAKDKGIKATATDIAEKKTVNGNEVVIAEFTDLELGYYLVDSTIGALCGLTTTDTTAEVNEKNGKPTVEKTVKEDDTDEYGKTNTAAIGETVEFKATVTVQAGAENYVLHDVMSAGLTFEEISSITVNGVSVAAENYSINDDPDDGCTFEITFTQEYYNSLNVGTEIVITYTAVLNKDAVIGGEGNKNTITLSYGDEHSVESTTTTYTYKFDIVKTDENGKVLTGAEFDLYDAETEGNQIALVKVEGNVYRVATTEEKNAEGFVSAKIGAGEATIIGLDNGTYYLEETTAPTGYNRLTARKSVEIKNENLEATVKEEVTTKDEEEVTVRMYVEGGVQVVNNTGTLLPSTGGMGTTLIYVVGGIMVLFAAVLLVVKRRMSKVA